MRRVDTGRHIAAMEDLHASRDLSSVLSPRRTVCEHMPCPIFDAPVAPWPIRVSGPQPAPRIRLGNESL